MNKIQSIFSIKRFGLLIKRETIMKQSFLLMAIAGVLITLTTVVVLVLVAGKNFQNWNTNKQFAVFAITFSIFGILFSGTAFPALRNNKKTLDFLLVPNSVTEKYLYEVLFRIFAYILVFPILFWISANLAGVIFNMFSIVNYDLGYHLFTPFKQIHENLGESEFEVVVYTLMLFIISIPFTGAAFFSKVPLLKTAIFLAVLVGVSFFYGWVLDKIFNYTHSHGFSTDISKETALKYFTAFILFSALVLHTSAFFRLKEREV